MTNRVVMYGASWCAPCKAVKPQFLAAAKGYLGEMGVEFEYLDVDVDPLRAATAGIRSVPSIKLYSDDTWVKDISSRTQAKMELEVEHAISTFSHG
jgi:thiol-disulfide isomerase/thioredoxin